MKNNSADEFSEDIVLLELQELKKKADFLKKKVLGETAGEDEMPPDLEEIREMLAILIEKQSKLENTFGVEKVSLKDTGERILVTLDTSFGTITTHTDKPSKEAGSHTPVTYSGSTVAGGGGPAPGVGSKGGGSHGMTPEQLQEFKKQTLQLAAAQQKLKELETKLTDAVTAIRKGQDKSADMEEKEAENVKELYTCIDNINTSLSEKIALQKVEVQKIAGDQPKPINYDPFNYGEAYAGDLVDFQARKRITELKLLMQGLQSALLQMRDSMKVSGNIDLGYKVVRLDQLVGSTGFGQKVQNGEVGPDEVLLLEQTKERFPGKVEYPRKSMNQTSQEQESRWSITDSIMQTMYRLEMELGEIQKIVDSTGMSSGSKTIEEVQQSIKQLKEKQIDLRTVKRLIEDAKESSMNLTAGRKSTTAGNPRATLTQIQGEASDNNVAGARKMEQALRQMQTVITSMNRRMSGEEKPTDSFLSAAATKKHIRGQLCLCCDRNVKAAADGQDVTRPSLPVYPYFNPLGSQPRIKGPTQPQYMMNRTFNIDLSRDKPTSYSIPRACGAGYKEYWPLPKSFNAARFQGLFDPPQMMNDTKYIKGCDGRYYRSQRGSFNPSSQKYRVPMSVLATKKNPRYSQTSDEFKVQKKSNATTKDDSEPDVDAPVTLVVMAASDEEANLREKEAEEKKEMEKEMEREMEASRRASEELKKYKFRVKRESDEDTELGESSPGKEGSGAASPADTTPGPVETAEEEEETGEDGD